MKIHVLFAFALLVSVSTAHAQAKNEASKVTQAKKGLPDYKIKGPRYRLDCFETKKDECLRIVEALKSYDAQNK